MHNRAEMRIIVQESEAKPYDESVSPALIEIHLRERFFGDIEGESPVRALQVLRDDKSASMVSIQRVNGRIGTRQGTFVLQGSEIVQGGKINATWVVVPGSGTGALSGCEVRVALRESLGRDLEGGWIIDSNEPQGQALGRQFDSPLKPNPVVGRGIGVTCLFL